LRRPIYHCSYGDNSARLRDLLNVDRTYTQPLESMNFQGFWFSFNNQWGMGEPIKYCRDVSKMTSYRVRHSFEYTTEVDRGSTHAHQLLVIHTHCALRQLVATFPHDIMGTIALDKEKVMECYSGIVFPNWMHLRAMMKNHTPAWFFIMDCDSGCVWRDLKKVTIS